MKLPHRLRRAYIQLMRFNRAANRMVVRLYHFIEINEVTGMVVLAFIIGIVGGYGAVGFRMLLNGGQQVFFGFSEDAEFITHVVGNIPWYYRLFIPVLGGLIIGPIIYFLAPEAKGHGVPEVMEAIITKGGWMRTRIVPLKALVSAVCIGSGGSAGREGPIVQIGSGTGSVIGQFLNFDENRRKVLIGCGAAAGIAGTFNAPIAGMMFSLEILLEEFRISQFSPLVVSSVISTVISQAYLGTNPAFIIPEYSLISAWEIIPYILLGLIAALAGILFSNSLYATEAIFNKIRIPGYLKPAIGGFILGAIALAVPNIYGVGYPTIELALSDQLTWYMLIILLVSKILATNITLGSGGSGGVFAPSLFIGSMTGGAFGNLVHGLFPQITGVPASYALVGMGAVVAAAAHAPLTAILILFEMTRDYHIILPLMLSCIISTVVAMQIQERNIYTTKLINRGIDVKSGREAPLLRSIRVREAMTKEVVSVDESAGTTEINRIFTESHHTHFPVTQKGSNKIIGILNYTDFWDYMDDELTKSLLIARDMARIPAITVYENDTLLTALNKISAYQTELLPVVSQDDHQQLVGVLSRNDIINTYNKYLRKPRT